MLPALFLFAAQLLHGQSEDLAARFAQARQLMSSGRFEEAIVAMREVIACHMVSGTVDYLLEVVVPDLAHYQKFLIDKLLALPIVREVQSSIAINTLKAGAPLPLDHLGALQSSNRRSAT